MMTKTFKQVSSALKIRFQDSDEEKEYEQVKAPLVNSLFKYLCGALSIILGIYVARYFSKGIHLQAYIVIGFVALSLSLFFCGRKLKKFLESALSIYLVLIMTLLITVFRTILSSSTDEHAAMEYFYMGFAFAYITRLMGYNIIKFQFMILIHATLLIINFTVLGMTEVFLTINVVLLEIVTLIFCLLNERDERVLFDSLYKSRKDVLKFKHLITSYFPNPLAIFDSAYDTCNYINNAYKRAFGCSKKIHAKNAIDSLFIEKETFEKEKSLFERLEYQEDESTSEPITLSSFLLHCSQKMEILRVLGSISLQVVEDENKMQQEILSDGRISPTKTNSPAKKKDVKNSWESKRGSKRSKQDQLASTDKDPCNSARDSLISHRQANPPRNNNSIVVDSSFKGSEKLSSNSQSDISDEGRRTFKIKIFIFMWDESESLAIVLDDITNQRKISELKVLDKNKDLVIATVSHELRTPLNGMLGLLDIVKKTIKQQDAIPYINACHNSGILLLNLVNSILDLSQIKNNKLKLVYSKVGLLEFLMDIKSLFDYFCVMKNLHLKIDVDKSLPRYIMTDRNRLSQIIINLLGNAFKFTFEGGVTIKVEPAETIHKIKFSIIDTGLGIRKEDQEKLFKMFGKIEQEDEKINTNGVGLGLTISNTLAILLDPSINGKGISLESEPNKGSKFSFVIQDQVASVCSNDLSAMSFENGSTQDLEEEKGIPVIEKVSQHTLNYISLHAKSRSVSIQTPLPHLPNKRSTFGADIKSSNVPSSDSLELDELRMDNKCGRNKIIDAQRFWKTQNVIREKNLEEDEISSKKPWCLVVDDNPFNLIVASHIMEERGYQIKTALNGKDAIEKIVEHEENGIKFRVILMDCQMPVMDGYEATGILRKMMKDKEVTECPIIAVTANNRNEEHDKLCEKSGMSGCINKPLQAKELEQMLKKVYKINDEISKHSI